MDSSTYKVRKLIHDIKRRWKWRALRQGMALVIFTCVFFAAALLLLDYKFDLPPFYRGAGIFIGSAFLLYILVQYLIRPLSTRIDDKRITLYIEETMPELEDRLNSVVEIDKNISHHQKNLIIDKLIDDATKKSFLIDITTVIDRKKEQILSYSANAVLALFILFVYTFFDDIRDVAAEFEISMNPMSELKQEFISLTPGNIEIEKGESQEIIAEMKHDSDEDVILHYKMGEDVWRRSIMEKGLDKPIFLQHFVNIQEPVKYYVEHNQQQTDEFEISLYEFPKVTNIDLKYTYPKYTGVPVKYEEKTADIRGLKGSKVKLTIETTGTVVSGSMVIEDQENVKFKSLGDGKYSAEIVLGEPSFYHIDLTDEQSKQNKFPEEYMITPVEDEQPLIYITDPQRDVTVNPVEEVLMSVTVTDDFGINDVKLNYSVNGDEEKSQNLLKADSKGKKTTTSSYIFYLEDFTLQAGDLISYYVEAADNFHTEFHELSDIYFIEVTALDKSFSQANNQGGGGGGGGGQSATVASQQEIISATFNLRRSRNKIDESEFDDALDAIIQSQAGLKDNIDERISSTAFSAEMLEGVNKEIADYFRKAVKEMEEALDDLDDKELKNALKDEQQALNNLLRADALNKERQVRQQRNQGQSGGGGGGSAEERMTELMDLELDISKDKYEVQQQRQQEQQQQEINEALEKVKELAKKQKKLAEQSQRSLQEEEEERFLDRLKRDQEELRQQAEELANQMRQMSRQNSQMSRQMQQSMQRASENMKKAEEALKEDNTQKALSQQQQAMNELDNLRRQLESSQTQNSREKVENFVDEFKQLKRQEQQLQDDLEQTFEESKRNPGRRADKEDLERLEKRREDIIQDLQKLENEAQSIEEFTRLEEPDISTTMRNFQRSLQREDLENTMRQSKAMIEQGWLSYAQSQEEEIQDKLSRLEEPVRRLENSIPVTEEELLNRSIQETRDLLTKYNEIVNNLRENFQSGQQGDSTGAGMARQGDPNQRDQQRLQRGQQGQQQQGRQGQQQQGRQQGQQQGQQGQQMQGGGGNRGARANEARLNRQLEQMQRQLENLERMGGGDQNFQNEIRSLRNALGRLHNTGVLLDEAGEEYFKQKVYAPLSQIEAQLLRRLDETEMDKKLFGGRKANVPPQYRKLVDKYYEAISKSKTIKKKK